MSANQRHNYKATTAVQPFYNVGRSYDDVMKVIMNVVNVTILSNIRHPTKLYV